MLNDSACSSPEATRHAARTRSPTIPSSFATRTGPRLPTKKPAMVRNAEPTR